MAQKTNTKSYIQAVGRRKTSAARVRLHTGKGENTVNEVPAKEYFPGLRNESIYMEPFRSTSTLNKYYFTAVVSGGGVMSQVAAVAHATARTLVKTDENLKPTLRKKGLLTRDPRMKERRKPGLAGAARAKKSSPKR